MTHTVSELDWRHQAACKDADPEVMQPEVASEQDVLDAIRAHCLGCPVWDECLQLAKDQVGGAYGIHGGQWFGDAPRRPGAGECGWCGGELEGERSTSRYCSAACRQAAHRARNAVSA